MASRRATQERDNTTAAHRLAAYFPDPVQSCLLPQSQLDREFRGSSWSTYVCDYAEVLPVVAPESLHQVLWRPWGRLHRLHQHRLFGSINPSFGLQWYVSKHQFTVTTLLVHRYLGNSGLRRNFFFVIFIKAQHTSIPKWYFTRFPVILLDVKEFVRHYHWRSLLSWPILPMQARCHK
jgi:hypothetical protein